MDIQNLKICEIREGFQERRYKFENTEEIEGITKKIISAWDKDVMEAPCGVPIVRISEAYGLFSDAKRMNFKTAYQLLVHGNTKKRYSYQEVVLINENMDHYSQRFFLAKAFTHYLFEVLGNPKYQDDSIFLKNTSSCVIDGSWDSQFAASLLMPRDTFNMQSSAWFTRCEKDMNENRRGHAYFEAVCLYEKDFLSRFFEVPEEAVCLRKKMIFEQAKHPGIRL